MKWWLSYAGDDFNGVVIVEAPSFFDACARSRQIGASPGGQVIGFPLLPPAGYVMDDEDRAQARLLATLPLDTLLTRTYLIERGIAIGRPQDLSQIDGDAELMEEES